MTLDWIALPIAIVAAIGGSWVAHWLIRLPQKRLKIGQPNSRSALLAVVLHYIGKLETDLTKDSCLCAWQDFTIAPSYKVLKRRVGEHQFCPVHTRAGLIVNFLNTYFPNLYPGEALTFDKLSVEEASKSEQSAAIADTLRSPGGNVRPLEQGPSL